MDTEYNVHISARHRLLDLKLKEVWQYRELIWLFTKRYFAVSYKQTILGPLWLFLTPLMTSVFHVILFGNIAKLSTDGVPQLLFYLAGNAVWSFFSRCFTGNASTFTSYAGLFGKVYFPRLAVPISNILCDILRFGIQMVPTLLLLCFYVLTGQVHPRFWLWPLIPLILLWMGLFGMGCGILVSSLTTKYRDLQVLVSFGASLWMYATPVVYPLSTVEGWLRQLLLWNPVTVPVELMRYVLLGVGTVEWGWGLLSLAETAAVCFLGILMFNRVERTFMDTV